MSGNAKKLKCKPKPNICAFQTPNTAAPTASKLSSFKINCHIHSFFSEMWSVRRHVVMFSSISVCKHWKAFSRCTWTEYAPSDREDLPRPSQNRSPFLPPELHRLLGSPKQALSVRDIPWENKSKSHLCGGGFCLKKWWSAKWIQWGFFSVQHHKSRAQRGLMVW